MSAPTDSQIGNAITDFAACPAWCDDHQVLENWVAGNETHQHHTTGNPLTYLGPSDTERHLRLRLVQWVGTDPDDTSYLGPVIQPPEVGSSLTPAQARALAAELNRLADLAES